MQLRSGVVGAALAGAALALSACAGATIPVAVILKNGHTFRGTVTGAFPTSFVVTDGPLSCSGQLPLAAKESATVSVVITCSDGRKGIALVSRETAFEGGGTLRLSDGTEGTFIYGDGAKQL